MTLPSVEAIRPTTIGLHTAYYRRPHPLSAWTLSSIGAYVANRPPNHCDSTRRVPPIPARHLHHHGR